MERYINQDKNLDLTYMKRDVNMKKIILALAILVMIASGTTVLAANGDISGDIYSTDIKAYINGIEVQSYNIGGKTAVVIEDILKAHDSYSYNDATRTLRFFGLAPDSLIKFETGQTEEVGKVIGNTYETDIKTEIYGVAINSYNIGGKTAVAIEDLGNDNEFSEIGGKYIWNGENRTINLEFMYDNDCGELRLKNKADVYTKFESDKECLDIPIVVLVNENSASASDVLTGALKEHKKSHCCRQYNLWQGCGADIVPIF